MSDKLKVLVEKFQCPGCVVGSDTGCGSYKPTNHYGESCGSHAPGTSLMGVLSGLMYLGLPKGFNRVGPRYIRSADGPGEVQGDHRIRMWQKGKQPVWDQFNVAVWAMEQDGFLFVRTYQPRINYTYVDIVEGGTMDMVPGAVDVGEFADEVD